MRTAGLLLALMLAACGSSTATRPSCSRFCQQAGPIAGEGPRDAASVLPGCPPEQGVRYCVRQESRTAIAHKGVLSLPVRCLASATCDGAVVVYSSSDLTRKGRLGASDFRIASHRTATVRVALTSLGARFLTAHQRYLAGTYFWLRGPRAELLFGRGDSVTVSTR